MFTLLAADQPLKLKLGEEAFEQGLITKPAVEGSNLFGGYIGNILQVILVIALLAVLIFLVWGAVEWIIAGGDKGKIETARGKITGALVGLIVLISSVAIFNFLIKILRLEDRFDVGTGNSAPAQQEFLNDGGRG